jgi:hypothetical protein
MRRPPLISLDLSLLIGAAAAATLSICGASVASGQATNAAAAAAPVETSTTLQCIQISRILARITVGRTHGTKLGLNIGKATGCNIAETDGAWDVYIYRRDAKGSIVDNETEDIQQDSCPVLSAHVKGLSAPRLTNPQWWVKPVTGVAVGPFFIENPAGLLRLGSEHDRHATEKWLRGTLAAVRSCWNHQDFGDGSHRLADRFYAAIGL